MLLQRQHFLLSYLKTLSFGPAWVWTYGLPLGMRSPNWGSHKYRLFMSLCFSLQDAFTVFGEYTDLEWRASTDQIIFKLVALIWTLKDGDPKIRDYTTSTFFNPVLGNVTNEKNKTKQK